MTQRSPAGSRSTEGLVPLGASLLLPLALLPPTLAIAGLAPLTVAAAVGLLVGVPTARALRAIPPGDTLRHRIVESVTDVAVLAVLAGTGAALLAPLSLPLAVALAVVGWTGAGWLADRDPRLRWQQGVSSAGLAILLGLVALFQGPLPITALEPRWSALPLALSVALLAGLWMGGLGGGQWSFTRRPGTSRAPLATAGLALLGSLGASLWWASTYETELALPGLDPPTGAVLALAWMSTASTWLARKSGAKVPWLTGGFVATAWLGGPALALWPVLALGGLPLVIAASIGLRAVELRGADRVVAALAAGLAGLASVAGLSQAPLETVGQAGVLALTVVATFWFVATTLVRTPHEVTP